MFICVLHVPMACAGSLDGSLIVWDAKAGQQSKQYSHHGAPIVDADWRNNTMFASCSQVRCVGPEWRSR